MDPASRFAALAHQGLPFYEYAREFCKLAAATAWDDATLNKLFWLGANHHRPVDLPDTTGLSWREGVWGVSRPEPEPARRHSRLLQARRRSRPTQAHCRSSTAPSSASPSNALSCACASRAPPSVCASRAPPSARSSPYFPQGTPYFPARVRTTGELGGARLPLIRHGLP